MQDIERFINELVVSFELGVSVEKALDKHVQKMQNDETFRKEQMDATFHHLVCYKNDILKVVEKQGKIKGEYFNFLDKIKLFNNLLNFQVFASENKNTKRTIVNNLYQYVFKTVEPARLETSLANFDTAELQKNLNDLPSDFQLQNLPNSISDIPTEALSSIPGLGTFLENDVISGIMNNTLSAIKDSGINPMEMLSDILSGKAESNEKLTSLMGNISKDLETRMTDGQVDEQGLKDLLANSSGLGGGLEGSGIQDALAKLMQGLPKN